MSWNKLEFLGIPRNSQNSGNSFRKGMMVLYSFHSDSAILGYTKKAAIGSFLSFEAMDLQVPFLQQYLSCGFIASNYESRVLIDP